MATGRAVFSVARNGLLGRRFEVTTTPYAPPAAVRAQQPQPGSSPLVGVAAVLLGVLVAVLGFLALLMWADSHDALARARAVPLAA